MLNLSGITIHLYGLLLGIGVYFGFLASLRLYPKLEKDLNKAFIFAVIGGVVGARLYHVIDFWDKYYRNNLEKIPVLWEGGLGIWGAILGAVIGLGIYCYFNNKKILPLLDAFSVGAPLAQAVGRLGNFVNGEIVGKNGEPLFAYESILNLFLFTIIFTFNRKSRSKTGQVLGIYLVGYGVIRIFLENFRPEEMIWIIGGVPTAIILASISILTGMVLIRRRQS